MNRILWNRRPTSPRDAGDIDEIVLHNATTIHIEQMDNRCWWIGITLTNGGYWTGNFRADSRGHMSFTEQDCENIDWQNDTTHEVTR